MTVRARSLLFRASVALGVAVFGVALHTTAGNAGEPFPRAGASAAAHPAGPPGDSAGVRAAATNSSVPHVMLIVEENRNRNEVIGAADMPYLNSLASKYTDTASWEGVGPSSLADYLALISGSTQGVTENPTEISFPGVPTLGSQLSEVGIPWKAYMEDMPAVGSEVAESGGYVKRHNPFAYFSGTNGPNVVPASEFAPDVAEGNLPPFVWYTPNLINDGHDGTNADVDRSLESIVPSVQASAWYKDGGVIIITWDENVTGPDVIPTVVVSGEGNGVSLTTSGNHYGTLAAIEDLYGLQLLGNAAHATPLLITRATGPKESTNSPGASGVSGTTSTTATSTTASTATATSTITPTPPVLASAAQSQLRWREGGLLTIFSPKHRLSRLGTTFSFTLNERANVSFAFTQQVGGRKVNGRCVIGTKENRHKPTCERTVSRGALSFTGHGGTNKVSFQGRMSASKKLPLGRYKLVITATNAVGQRSSPKSVYFTIVK